MKSKIENLLLWEQRIKERVQSRITVDEWCLKNGLSKHQYYYWNHRVSKKQKTDEEMTFTDITPILKKTDTARPNPVLSSDFQILINDIQVTVPSSFNPVSLTGLMKVLQEL